MPVMEGKALLFKHFAGVDAFPICVNTKNPDEIIETVLRLEPTFGGINLEDIAAPGAFEVEERLDAEMDIPVFHDDQHGTAIVTLAALENALKIVDKKHGRSQGGRGRRRRGRRRRVEDPHERRRAATSSVPTVRARSTPGGREA